MRQVTIIKTYLTFEELNSDQQRKVLDKYRYINVDEDYWNEHITESFSEALAILGFSNIKTNFSGFASQGDGASFSAYFDLYGVGVGDGRRLSLEKRLDALEKEFPNFFKDMPAARELYLSLTDEGCSTEVSRSGRYYHEYTMYSEHDDLLEFSRMMAKKYYRDLEESYFYETGDAAVSETLKANEYEFDSDTLEIAHE